MGKVQTTSGRILVAVTFDEHAGNLLKSAYQIAERTSLGLEVLHVSEYWVGRTWPSDGLLATPLNGAVNAIEDQTIDQARRHLRSMVETHLPDKIVTQKILLGYPVDCIRAHGESCRASLIVLGGLERDYRFVPRGFSTVLALQHDAPCPVLVVPKNRVLEWNFKERLSVILADDLTAETAKAVTGGFEFAEALGNTDVSHVHVNSLAREALTSALVQVAAAAHTPENVLTGDAVWDSAMKSIERAIERRGGSRRQRLESSGGHVKTHVLHGDPQEEISMYAEREHADLLVFGRHRTWHQKPFSLGRMPFHSMLKAGLPVLIADR